MDQSSGVVRYGKSNAAYLRMRRSLVEEARDPAQLDRFRRVARLYAAQPERRNCVVCDGTLGPAILTVLGVGYTLCPGCGHFNGLRRDTPEFGRALYELDGGDLAATYLTPDPAAFAARVEEVYSPKVDFLRDALRADGVDPAALRYADIGAGAGHFVAALRRAGLADCVGYDPAPRLVQAGNALLGAPLLERIDIEAFYDLARTVDADVVTMIFSLEHLPDLPGFMTALRANRRVRHFFFAVPTFSSTVYLEAAFQGTVPRTLGNGHTHLFCDASLDAFCARHRLRRVAEWWFGGAAFDLYRHVGAALAAAGQPPAAVETWRTFAAPLIDDLQLTLDRRKWSSEVHFLAGTPPSGEGDAGAA